MGEAYFDSLIATAVEVANERNMYLYCGEYGVIDRAHPNERLEYLRCISQVFMKHNIGRALWNYKGLDFGLIDETYDSIRKDVITLL
jgi:endoglucanase